ncbi:MAG TPA: hypothetical protein DCM05_14790 [Elusimicrobia bacterium]|nr:hypothetical protein [Elusimicrobiota bacterium]
MEPLQLLLILVGLALPIGIYLWHDRSHNNPGSRWPSLAKMLEFAYTDDPPRLSGVLKERQVDLFAADGGAVMTLTMRVAGAFRVEIGPREEVEKASGMIVPDKVEIRDSALGEKFMARATPAAAGEAVDLNVLRKLLQFPGAWVLVVPGRAELRLPSPPNEAAQVREAADILVSLAEALEGL